MLAEDIPALAILHTVLPLWLLGFAAGAFVPWLLLRQARVWDYPGRHKSHDAPVVRGGGLGIPLVAIGSLIGAMAATGGTGLPLTVACLAMAIAFVAAIGWADDLRGLGIAPRLGVHVVAGILVVVALHRQAHFSHAAIWDLLAAALAALAIAWSVNMHNFMDGANGLLLSQALFVLGTVASLAFFSGHPILLSFSGAAFFACLGCLPFNFPRARIFLGDVGSGSLGLIIAIASLLALQASVLPLPAILALISAFAIDGTLTLLHRIATRKRWYHRHREHLYQWLVRQGWSHTKVTAAYAGWNACVALPLVLFEQFASPALQWSATVTAYAMGAALWILAKKRILEKTKVHAQRVS